jgi:FkbM family methyltransferase
MKMDDGSEVEYVCLNNWVARWAAKEILAGKTYPRFDEVPEASTIVDIGANCGAASVHFARTYPNAMVHALEPARAPYVFLEKNAKRYPNILPERIGLLDRDDCVPLYHGKASAGASSIFKSEHTTDSQETVVLRSTKAWLNERGIDRIDIVKIDTEGCEVPILEALADRLPDVQALYLEFHSEEDRARIESIVSGTHELRSIRSLHSVTGELAFLNHRSARTLR